MKAWFDEFSGHVRKSLDEPGYASSEEGKQKKKDLRVRWKKFLDADSAEGRKWKADVDALREELRAFDEAVRGDADLERVREAHAKLGRDIESGLVEASVRGAQTGVEAVMEKATWFWQDLFKVYVPRFLNMMKDVPIPRCVPRSLLIY